MEQKEKTKYEKRNFNQIIRIDANDTFIEFLDSAFAIGKVLINLIKYDKKTTKQIDKVTFYLDFKDFLILKQDFISGKLNEKGKRLLEKNPKGFPTPSYMKQGGVSAENLAARGQSRPDGAPLARALKIMLGQKWMIQGEEGKGEKDGQGLIIPRYGSKPDKRVMVPMDADTLKGALLLVDKKISSYMAAQYVYVYKEQFLQQAQEEADKKALYSVS